VLGATPFKAATDDGRDPQRSLMRGLVLPNTHRKPPGSHKEAIDFGIALPVIADLGGPVLRIGSQPPAMYGTTVPEASVHEHGHSRPAKH
jgi:hypothetical protein